MQGELFNLILSYGYLAVFVGAIFDGEVSIFLASLFAHAGYLSIPKLFITILAGAVAGDMTWFLLGRYKGQVIIGRFPRFHKFVKTSASFAWRRPVLVSFSMRFMYGFRNVVPFSLGLSDVPLKKFFIANLIGALLWTTVVGSAAYFFADLLERYIGTMRQYDLLVAAGIIVVIVLIHIIAQVGQGLVSKFIASRKARQELKENGRLLAVEPLPVDQEVYEK